MTEPSPSPSATVCATVPISPTLPPPANKGMSHATPGTNTNADVCRQADSCCALQWLTIDKPYLASHHFFTQRLGSRNVCAIPAARRGAERTRRPGESEHREFAYRELLFHLPTENSNLAELARGGRAWGGHRSWGGSCR